MQIKTVLILSPGEMGAAVGHAFHQSGFEILGVFNDRTRTTQKRAIDAGFKDAGSLNIGLKNADIVLSILPPAHALHMAKKVADGMQETGAIPPYVDCNAISPETAKSVAITISKAGSKPIDVGIVGNPPKQNSTPPRFFASGVDAKLMDTFSNAGIVVKNCGQEIGQASAVKMVYAGITKGVSALFANMLIAADKLGVADTAHEELMLSQDFLYRRMQNLTPSLPAVSERYIGEMEEIAKTCRAIGITAGFHDGAADLYRLMSRSPFSKETRETVDQDRDMRSTIITCSKINS